MISLVWYVYPLIYFMIMKCKIKHKRNTAASTDETKFPVFLFYFASLLRLIPININNFPWYKNLTVWIVYSFSIHLTNIYQVSIVCCKWVLKLPAWDQYSATRENSLAPHFLPLFHCPRMAAIHLTTGQDPGALY